MAHPAPDGSNDFNDKIIEEFRAMSSCGVDGGSDGCGNLLNLRQDAAAASDG